MPQDGFARFSFGYPTEANPRRTVLEHASEYNTGMPGNLATRSRVFSVIILFLWAVPLSFCLDLCPWRAVEFTLFYTTSSKILRNWEIVRLCNAASPSSVPGIQMLQLEEAQHWKHLAKYLLILKKCRANWNRYHYCRSVTRSVKISVLWKWQGWATISQAATLQIVKD